ncbi:glycosyltransferase [Pelagibius sp. Alg239-R121]|uniref:glycosyltransferase n=1 Tax=Pelagibius sp. Alg239-R121 TaxID=2993448 RepID=UPI0024A6994C|nr:glycosyltransferase [Pelagibius sp. Alg239-R121]
MALKVLYVTMQFPVPSETFAAVEIRALLGQEVEVAIATFKPKPKDCNDVLRDRRLPNIEIDHNSLFSSLRGLWVALRPPSLPLRLLGSLFTRGNVTAGSVLKSLALVPRTLDLFDKIRRSPPDIVHLYWGHYPSLLGLLVHELLEDVTLSLSLSAYDLHSRYGPSIELARQAPLVFTLARANTPALKNFGVLEGRVHVVYHGIDVEPETFRDAQEKTLEVVIAERLVPLKRTTESLRVFRRVLDKCPAARLSVLGDGPEKMHLQEMVDHLGIGDAVQFLGHVSHEEVFEQFSKSKVLLSMSSSERLPNTVKEAMLRNCIPVVSRTMGIDELISNQKTGFIIEQGDIDQAAYAVVRCLQEWESLSNLRVAARHHITENFSSQAVALQRREIWKKTIDNRRRP